MGYHVHLSVTFSCYENDGVALLAKQHLAALNLCSDENLDSVPARWFLQALSERTGQNFGPRGGLSQWGMIGNYTKADSFVEQLSRFWFHLLTLALPGGPARSSHILVFYELPDSLYANAFELMLDDKWKQLVIKHHVALPFKWNQY